MFAKRKLLYTVQIIFFSLTKRRKMISPFFSAEYDYSLQIALSRQKKFIFIYELSMLLENFKLSKEIYYFRSLKTNLI